MYQNWENWPVGVFEKPYINKTRRQLIEIVPCTPYCCCLNPNHNPDLKTTKPTSFSRISHECTKFEHFGIIRFWVMFPRLVWKNTLIDHVTLTFDLSTPKHFWDISRSFIPIPTLNTLGSFVFELCSGQTNKQTRTSYSPTLSACVMPRLHQRNKLRATSCAQLDACCAQQVACCALCKQKSKVSLTASTAITAGRINCSLHVPNATGEHIPCLYSRTRLSG